MFQGGFNGAPTLLGQFGMSFMPPAGKGALIGADKDQKDLFAKGSSPQGDYAEYYTLIKRMDTAIDEGSGNPYLRESLEGLRTHLQRLRQIAKRRPPRTLQTVVEHLAICAAIHDGDETAAAQATALHISNNLHNILAVSTNGTQSCS